MKLSVWILVLLAVFLTATFATAFSLTLMTSQSPNGESYPARFVQNAYSYGWAGGVVVTAIFFFMRRGQK